MPEDFRPVPNIPPAGFSGKLKFYGRMLLDLQMKTTYGGMKSVLPAFRGNVLDIGCGNSPYKHLLNPPESRYVGIDIIDAEKFDCANPDITPFNGEDIPFENEKFDAFICTEVLEHVRNSQKLIEEMYRVLKKGGRGIITIPWSARYFFRFTPSSLKSMFWNFHQVEIKPRGTDVTSIVSKIIVLWARNLLPSRPRKCFFYRSGFFFHRL